MRPSCGLTNIAPAHEKKSSLDYRRSDARIVENGFATSSGVSISAKVVLGANPNSPFVGDENDKNVRRSYWLDMDDRTKHEPGLNAMEHRNRSPGNAYAPGLLSCHAGLRGAGSGPAQHYGQKIGMPTQHRHMTFRSFRCAAHEWHGKSFRDQDCPNVATYVHNHR
jgi:hypothetical protein